MRKNCVSKRLLSIGLVLCLMTSALPAALAGTESGSATIPGQEETISLSSDYQGERVTSFNQNWKFILGDYDGAENVNYDTSNWEKVSIPHDFSISQGFTLSGEAESGFLPGGTGWYRKEFTLPVSCSGKQISLNFDGVYAHAYVYVNGHYVGEHHYGYSSFAFDITDQLICDGATMNVIAVKAVNQIPSSRWYSGSGIYRDVDLIVTEPVHVSYQGVGITTPDIAAGTGTVQAKITVDCDAAQAATVTVQTSVLDAQGQQVATGSSGEVTVPAGGSQSVTVTSTVSDPARWSVNDPNLYTLRTEILQNGQVVDTVDTQFGFRWFAFDRTTGFSLNGENLKLNGVCLHHDQGALGSAAYDDAMERQLQLMKDMGVNAIRTSHNPADEDLIRLCNEMGLLVIEEAFDGWSNPKNGNYNDFSQYFNQKLPGGTALIGGSAEKTWAQFAIQSMVSRDRNAPCIIAWSLGNEILEGCYGVSGSDYPEIAQNLIDWVKAVDTTRPTTVGDNNVKNDNQTYIAVCNVIAQNDGIVGLNYCSDTQTQEIHDTYPDWTLYAAETSSAINSRGVYDRYTGKGDKTWDKKLNSYDESAVGWGMTAHDSMYNTMTKDYIAGEFVWTGIDYIGEPTPWNGTDIGQAPGGGTTPNSSYFGIVDTAGFPKDTYYLYRSQWNQNATTLHLVTAWDADNQSTIAGNGMTPVVIYSNAPKVELYRNGVRIGTATRQENETAAGHSYYTYTTQVESGQESICTAVNATGADSLYATFHVSYQPGTISAKALDNNNQEITDVAGKTSISTPGTDTTLLAVSNQAELEEDGNSLAYVELTVQDEQGTLDTMATQEIHITLTGPGKIVGVDNGDQATTAKYQQSSVLLSDREAKIQAFAGKALVIVQAGKESGTITLNASADGLSAQPVSIAVKASEETQQGLASYTMVRDYTMKVGSIPQLNNTATGTLANGTQISGSIAWQLGDTPYNTAGDYVISGTLTFEGYDSIPVTARLHVIDQIVALENQAVATAKGKQPVLPALVSGINAKGEPAGQFAVDWTIPEASRFGTVGEIVIVQGTAQIFGSETLPVTASVRVAEEVNTESSNVAPQASKLEQDIPKEYQSDNLNSIKNEITKPGDKPTERWSNWKNRTNSETASLTFSWDTAQMIGSVKLYYYYDNCAAYPESVQFAVSGGGDSFTEIESTKKEIETYQLGACYEYTFAQPVNPVKLRITLTQQGGTSGTHCVALTECEIMTYAGAVKLNSSADLSEIRVDGTPLAGFAAETVKYTVAARPTAVVTASSAQNAAVTILPAVDGTVKILTRSEDGSDSKTYILHLTGGTAIGKEDLKNKIAEASNYQNQTDIYTETSLQKLREAIVAATDILEDENAAQEAIQNAYDALNAAIAGLVRKPTTGGTVPEVEVELTGDGTNLTLRAQIVQVPEGAEITEVGFVYLEQAKRGTRYLNVNTAGRTKATCSTPEYDYTYTFAPTYPNTEFAVRAYVRYQDGTGTHYAYSPLAMGSAAE